MQDKASQARPFVREHTGLTAGLGCLAIAVLPLALFSLLQLLGFFPGSNGLGFGLLFAFGAPIAFAVIAIGAVLDYVLRERRTHS
jgi:hypothetical protein